MDSGGSENHCSLVFSACFLLQLRSICSDWHDHNGLGLTINHLLRKGTIVPYRSVIWKHFLNWGSSYWITLALVNLTKKLNRISTLMEFPKPWKNVLLHVLNFFEHLLLTLFSGTFVLQCILPVKRLALSSLLTLFTQTAVLLFLSCLQLIKSKSSCFVSFFCFYSVIYTKTLICDMVLLKSVASNKNVQF